MALLSQSLPQHGGQLSRKHIFFIRIMNNFGLLFEYSNNIRILILLNKLPILAQNLKKNPKNPKKIQKFQIV
jgi:hypothetical protein